MHAMTSGPSAFAPRAFRLLVAVFAVLTVVGWTAAARAAETHEEPVVSHEGAPHAAVETSHATATGEGGHQEEAAPPLIKKPGLPEALTTITTLVIFCLLVAVLSKYAWGPIVKGLEARENKIRNDIRDAESNRGKAEATLRQYQQQLATAEQQVRDLLAKASADAQQLATSIRTNAQAEAEEAKERATKEIESAKQQALGEIYDQAATLGTSIAEKILRRNINPDDQRDLVQASIEQMKTA